MIHFTTLDPRITAEHLGYLPDFLDAADPRPAAEQLNQNYAHGGGWHPLEGWVFDPITRRIRYPGDPPLKPLAMALMREETLFFYDHAWLAIVQPNGSYEVARVD